jgi:hypothetical protein
MPSFSMCKRISRPIKADPISKLVLGSAELHKRYFFSHADITLFTHGLGDIV